MTAASNEALLEVLARFEDNLTVHSLGRSEAFAEYILDRFEQYEDVIEPWLEFRLEAEEERREALEETEDLAADMRSELADHYEELEEMREELAEDGPEDAGFTAEDLAATEAYLDCLSNLLDATLAAGTLNEDSPIIAMIDDDFSFEEGSRRADDLDGTNGGDFMLGLGGADVLDGRRGADRLDGGRGNDDIDGGNGSDVLVGGAGRDKLDGGAGTDNLDGGGGRDVLFGGAGNDVLMGGDGRDVLKGGDGDDVMSGGAGADTFVFKRAWDGAMSITDYDAGEGDRLSLRGVRIEDIDHVQGEVVVSLSNGATIEISGTDLGDFIF